MTQLYLGLYKGHSILPQGYLYKHVHCRFIHNSQKLETSWIVPVMSIKCPFPSLLIDFSLKSILLEIRMTTLTCFLGPFAWKTFSQHFTLSRWLSLWLKCISCKQQNVGSCFCIQSLSLCLFIGELSPLILSDINDQRLLTLVIIFYLFILCVCVVEFVCFPSLSCGCEGLLDVWVIVGSDGNVGFLGL